MNKFLKIIKKKIKSTNESPSKTMKNALYFT